MHLRSQDRRHGRNRIARLMREQGICGRQRKRYRVVTTDSNHDQPIAPNRLAELPAPHGPDQVWVADITYVSTAQGWAYVAAVLKSKTTPESLPSTCFPDRAPPVPPRPMSRPP
jgi:transposase InsO family protein